MAIEHILFDADGVIQDATTHWQPGLQSALKLEDESQAKAVLQDVFAAEAAVLEVNGGFTEQLEAVLAKWERNGFLSEALSVIHAIEVKQDVMRAVQAIRGLGIRCHIGSNQQTLRATHVRRAELQVLVRYRVLFLFRWSSQAETGFLRDSSCKARLRCQRRSVHRRQSRKRRSSEEGWLKRSGLLRVGRLTASSAALGQLRRVLRALSKNARDAQPFHREDSPRQAGSSLSCQT